MIYLIVCDATNTCKIGYSVNPTNRLKQIQGCNPYSLHLKYIVNGEMYEERMLHKKFRAFAVSREWYLYNNEIEEYFATQKKRKKRSKVILKKEVLMYEFDEENEDLFIDSLTDTELTEYHKLKEQHKLEGKPFDMKEGADYARFLAFSKSDRFKPSRWDLMTADCIYDLMPINN